MDILFSFIVDLNMLTIKFVINDFYIMYSLLIYIVFFTIFNLNVQNRITDNQVHPLLHLIDKQIIITQTTIIFG